MIRADWNLLPETGRGAWVGTFCVVWEFERPRGFGPLFANSGGNWPWAGAWFAVMVLIGNSFLDYGRCQEPIPRPLPDAGRGA